MTFEEWMKQVDEECWRRVGCSVYDLPDAPFRAWYGNMEPAMAAQMAIDEDW